MKKIFIHLTLAFILATQIGCSVRVLTFNDSSSSSKPYEFSLFEVGETESNSK